jgi:hypothetical protein
MALLVEPPGEVQLEELAGGHRCCTFCCTGRKVPQPSRGKPSLTRGGAKGTRTPNMPVAAPARPRLDVAIHSCDELAAVSLSGKSAYCSTSSAMRSESAGLRSTGTNSPAADSRKNAASARAASSGLKHVADLCRHSGRHEQFLGLQSRATRCTRWCGSLSAPAGTRGPESTKITAEHSPQDLFSAFCQVGFVTRGAANEGFPRRTRFLAPLFVMRFSLLSGFRLGASHHS